MASYSEDGNETDLSDDRGLTTSGLSNGTLDALKALDRLSDPDEFDPAPSVAPSYAPSVAPSYAPSRAPSARSGSRAPSESGHSVLHKLMFPKKPVEQSPQRKAKPVEEDPQREAKPVEEDPQRKAAKERMRAVLIERRSESKELEELYDVFRKNKEEINRRIDRDWKQAESPDDFVRSLSRDELAQRIARLREEEKRLRTELENIKKRVAKLKSRTASRRSPRGRSDGRGNW
jgi:hypothetical protein